MSERVKEALPVPNPKQNSEIRAKTAKLRFGVARSIHRALPKMTANQMTYLGLGLKTAGVAVAEWQNITGNKNKLLRGAAFGAVLAGELADGADGPLSVIIHQETGEKDENGGHKDVLADRFGEIIHNFLKAIRAFKLGHTYGSRVALANAVETTLPSALKSGDELLGYHPPENVCGPWRFLPLGFLGGRTGRPFLNIPATFFPEAQPVLDTIQVAANTYAAVERIKYPFDSSHSRDLPQNYREESKTKAGLLTGVLVGSSLIALALNKRFKSNP